MKTGGFKAVTAEVVPRPGRTVKRRAVIRQEVVPSSRCPPRSRTIPSLMPARSGYSVVSSLCVVVRGWQAKALAAEGSPRCGPAAGAKNVKAAGRPPQLSDVTTPRR